MTRKEMIERIAEEAGCSKRLVRKKLFKYASELKGHYWRSEFTRAFLNKNTEWRDFYDVRDAWKKGDKSLNPWRTVNTFEVCHFVSGFVVLFKVKRVIQDYETVDTIGTRLYSF